MTLAGARAELDSPQSSRRPARGRYWRRLDELADAPGFDGCCSANFPPGVGVGRSGLAARIPQDHGRLDGDGRPVRMHQAARRADLSLHQGAGRPDSRQAQLLRERLPFNTGALPLLVKSDAYRPIKVDGNPDHPMNRGSSDPLSQGSLLGLYDPDRSPACALSPARTAIGPSSSRPFRRICARNPTAAQGVYILSSTVTSPTLAGQIKTRRSAWPKAKFLQYDPVNRDSAAAPRRLRLR